MPRRKLTAKEKSFNKIIRRYYKKTGSEMFTKNKKSDGNYETKGISKIQFRHRVQATMKAYDLSPLQAAKKVLNTESFTTAAERSRTNLLNSMRKEFNADYKDLVKLNRQISRDLSVDPSSIQIISISFNVCFTLSPNTFIIHII